jgi:hypothetical protein
MSLIAVPQGNSKLTGRTGRDRTFPGQSLAGDQPKPDVDRTSNRTPLLLRALGWVLVSVVGLGGGWALAAALDARPVVHARLYAPPPSSGTPVAIPTTPRTAGQPAPLALPTKENTMARTKSKATEAEKPTTQAAVAPAAQRKAAETSTPTSAKATPAQATSAPAEPKADQPAEPSVAELQEWKQRVAHAEAKCAADGGTMTESNYPNVGRCNGPEATRDPHPQAH